jgi:hypothetical protein
MDGRPRYTAAWAAVIQGLIADGCELKALMGVLATEIRSRISYM